MNAAASTPRAAILPFYLVCDVSASMAREGRMDALNDAIASLRDAMWANPVVSDCTRLGVVGFSSTAEVQLPLCDLAFVDELPRLRPGGLTSYVAAFTKLRHAIEADVSQLVADEYRVFRPLVFFLSDGEPTDATASWLSALGWLIAPDFPHRPDIVALGVGGAGRATMRTVGTLRSFIADDPTEVAAAIGSVGDLVVRSVVASGVANRPVLPLEPPEGFSNCDDPDIL